MTEIKEVKKKKATTKPKTTKPKTTKVVKEVVEVEEIIVEPVKVRKNYRQLRSELVDLKNRIEVEIVNLNSGETYYRDKEGREIFRLKQPSDRTFVLLSDLYDISVKHNGYFKNHLIAITDVISDEYDLEDIIEYLNLKEVYTNIENYDTDYVGYILMELDIDKFERVVNQAEPKLLNSLAARAVALYRAKKFDSRLKEDILARKLNRPSLID